MESFFHTLKTDFRAAEAAAEEALASAQAAHLAAKLESGVPCPVCGSTEHPRPAGGAEEGLGLDAAWRQAQNGRHGRRRQKATHPPQRRAQEQKPWQNA